MIRKHTRRAVKAAFCISFGVAIVLGGLAGGALSAGSAQQTIKLGTKDFSEEFILGQLYKQALEAKGLKVDYHENIGSTEVIDTALTSGKIDVYPEYTGTILSVVFHKATVPKSAAATYAQAKALEERRGFTLFNQTPFSDTDAIGTLTPTAKKYGLRTIGDLKKVPGLSICALPTFKTRLAGLVGIKQTYGVKNITFIPLSGISFYTALDAHKCTVSDVFSTDPQLEGTKYKVLKDTKFIFGFQNVAPVVRKTLVASLGSKFRSTMNAVSAKLTQQAIIAMNKAVSIDHKSPAVVASAFLKANHLK